MSVERREGSSAQLRLRAPLDVHALTEVANELGYELSELGAAQSDVEKLFSRLLRRADGVHYKREKSAS